MKTPENDTMDEEPESMKEIHRIREKLYEEAKGMTLEEQTKLSRARVDAFLKEQGLNLRTVEKTAK